MSTGLSVCRQQILRCRLNNYFNLRSIIIHQRKFSSNLNNSNPLVTRIKDLLITIQTTLPLLPPSNKKQLNKAQTDIDSIFSLVVVGEFNSGKSQLINTLLNEKICLTGVKPTTDLIHILKYGPKRKDNKESDDVYVKSTYLPNEWLRQTNIVDTPGTNAILQTHQQITERFIPRSDYILFVTSVDRPFSESERLFLVRIHEWKKKVLIIVNKIDQIQQDIDQEEILDHVRDNAHQVLDDISVPIFPISALKSIGIKELENHLRTELNDKTKLKLKLENPLRTAERIVEEYSLNIQKEKRIFTEDEQIVLDLQNNINQDRQQMLDDFKFQLNKIDNICYRMIDNMEELLVEYMPSFRFSPTLADLSSSSELKVEFNNRINKNFKENISQCISHLCDWFSERSNETVDRFNKNFNSEIINLRRQKHAIQYPDGNITSNSDRNFSISSQQILNQLQTECRNILSEQKTATDAQTDELSGLSRWTRFVTTVVVVGTVPLGVFVASASSGGTGVLSATVLGIFGIYIIPLRCSRIKRQMKNRFNETRTKLTDVLNTKFKTELDRAEDKKRKLIMPYSRFVQDEQEKLKKTIEQIDLVRKQIKQLKLDIQTSLSQKEKKE